MQLWHRLLLAVAVVLAFSPLYFAAPWASGVVQGWATGHEVMLQPVTSAAAAAADNQALQTVTGAPLSTASVPAASAAVLGDDENAKGAPVGSESIQGGRCGAEFMQPPCDLWRFIDYDMSKWKDGSVHSSQVALSKQGPEKATHPIDRKEALLGSFDGEVLMVYSQFNKDKLDGAIHNYTAPVLVDLARHVALDVEMVVHTSDLPVVERGARPVPCTGRMVISSSSGPSYCDLALPPQTRPFIIPVDNDLPYAEKHNVAFWRGGVHVANRCGRWRQSPRILMAQASVMHPDVINASHSGVPLRGDFPADMLKAVKKLVPHRVPMEEQFKYRFLPTSTPPCTFTGRVLRFLSTNSVVAMFSNGPKAVSPAAYAAFQENVHFKYLHVKRFVEEIRSMQASWQQLAALPQNARRKIDWVLRDEVRRCYFYELLMAIKRKLAYRPSKDGSIKELLRRSSVDTKQTPYLQGAEVLSTVSRHGEKLYIERLAVTPQGIDPTAELLKSCEQVKAEMPRP